MTDNQPQSNVHSTTEQLERILAETEALSAQLRREIQLQRQHEAVEKLPELITAVDQGKWSNLKLLIQEILNEFRGRRSEDETAADADTAADPDQDQEQA